MKCAIKQWVNFTDKFGIAMGGCAGALAVSNLILVDRTLSPIPVFGYVVILGLLTMSVYNFDRWHDAGTDQVDSPIQWQKSSRPLFISFVIIPIIISCITFLYFNQKGAPGALAFLAIALLGFVYTLPVAPHRRKGGIVSWSSPKGVPCAKSFYVSAVWFLALYTIPILIFEWNLIDHLFFNLVVFFRLLVNCIAGDIRDLNVDRLNGLFTLPGVIGERVTILSVIAFNLVLLLCAVILMGSVDEPNLLLLFGGAQILIILMWMMQLLKKITPSHLLVYSVLEILLLPLILFWIVG